MYDALEAGKAQALDELVKAVTVHHTYFFREREHYATLVEDVRQRQVRRPALWCAASSTGEEPYSIAISLLEAGVTDFRVVASDIDKTVLHEMSRGVYTSDELTRSEERRVGKECRSR